MSDNKEKQGKPDSDRINLSEDYEVRYWSEKFGVTSEKLRDAVNQAGSMARDVEAYLKTNQK